VILPPSFDSQPPARTGLRIRRAVGPV